MARPDASPEHDVISLQIVSLAEAQHLFDSYGSFSFDNVLLVCLMFAQVYGAHHQWIHVL